MEMRRVSKIDSTGVVVLNKHQFSGMWVLRKFLTAEAVQGAALALQCVHHVQSSYGFPARVLGVGDCVSDDILKEDLQDTASLFVDEATNTLNTATSSQTADGRLRDALNVIAQHLAVTLGATFAEALSTLTASGHDSLLESFVLRCRLAFLCVGRSLDSSSMSLALNHLTAVTIHTYWRHLASPLAYMMTAAILQQKLHARNHPCTRPTWLALSRQPGNLPVARPHESS